MGDGVWEVYCGVSPVPRCVSPAGVEAQRSGAFSLSRYRLMLFSSVRVGVWRRGAYPGDVPPDDATSCLVLRHLGTMRGSEDALSCG